MEEEPGEGFGKNHRTSETPAGIYQEKGCEDCTSEMSAPMYKEKG
jgi:hypothetical protein